MSSSTRLHIVQDMYIYSLVPCTYPLVHQSFGFDQHFSCLWIINPYLICFLEESLHTFNCPCWMLLPNRMEISLGCLTGWTCMIYMDKSQGTSLHVVYFEVCNYRKAFPYLAICTL